MEDLKFYTATVPFEVGIELKKAGYWDPHCTYESNYGGPCYFIPSKKYYGDGVVAPWDEIVPAPTYGEVFDWFMNKDMLFCIDYESLNPLKWSWVIQYIGNRLETNNRENKPQLAITEYIFDKNTDCANSAILSAVEILKQDKQ